MLLVALGALILIVVLSSAKLVTSQPLGVVTAVVVALTAIVLWRLGIRQSASVAAEKDAGYSTLYDFEGFELRDYRDGTLIRPRNVEPGGGIRRSLVSGMLTVRTGSPLARRIAEDAARGGERQP